MIHPDSELLFVSPQIGIGVFATKFIPRGTVTWVFDALDQVIPADRAARLPARLEKQLDIYSYRNGRGDRILCWDHARFVNHSCLPTSLAPGLDLEIAVRDIQPGEQITDDYGSLNIDEPFACDCGLSQCRGIVRPDDFERHADIWDDWVSAAFPQIGKVKQPLWDLVKEQSLIEDVLAGKSRVPSCRAHLLETVSGRR